jgi:hypothetical protein
MGKSRPTSTKRDIIRFCPNLTIRYRLHKANQESRIRNQGAKEYTGARSESAAGVRTYHAVRDPVSSHRRFPNGETLIPNNAPSKDLRTTSLLTRLQETHKQINFRPTRHGKRKREAVASGSLGKQETGNGTREELKMQATTTRWGCPRSWWDRVPTRGTLEHCELNKQSKAKQDSTTTAKPIRRRFG